MGNRLCSSMEHHCSGGKNSQALILIRLGQSLQQGCDSSCTINTSQTVGVYSSLLKGTCSPSEAMGMQVSFSLGGSLKSKVLLQTGPPAEAYHLDFFLSALQTLSLFLPWAAPSVDLSRPVVLRQRTMILRSFSKSPPP